MCPPRLGLVLKSLQFLESKHETAVLEGWCRAPVLPRPMRLVTDLHTHFVSVEKLLLQPLQIPFRLSESWARQKCSSILRVTGVRETQAPDFPEGFQFLYGLVFSCFPLLKIKKKKHKKLS